ncbi:vomeronasal type-2 receptor 26, partial [Xenopus tropicalis]|uniref:Vomeronasal type-2 receptor 26 n=1 Tax=Xenopus tropicalis TaxID=8364 RepID=A0A8J0SZZ6_XENTR
MRSKLERIASRLVTSGPAERSCAEKKRELHHYLKRVTLTDTDNLSSYFDENGEFITHYGINNLFLKNRFPFALSWAQVGKYTPWAPPDQRLNITTEAITWNTLDNKVKYVQVILKGQVVEDLGHILIQLYSDNCFRCPDLEWPNNRKNQCIPKKEDFLSYTTDVISIVLSSVSVLFLLITFLILGVFIKYRDSPIVRANNRSLSFLLLVSIKLSFLSVFLFLGRPGDITCRLRNITYGIAFSIAVSSLLAKTIMVYIAFKSTKPGSSWGKWMGVKLSKSVVLVFSSIQIIICITWLAIFPPFQELDIHTYPGTIIIQCNEGSALGFYSVIGYMGLLAAVSFVLAFLARSLPDSFNEAKYI